MNNITRTFQRLTFTAVLLTLTACSLSSEPQVTYVVVTSTPPNDARVALQTTESPTETPAPTNTPMPTLTSTPDLAPDVALRVGDRYLLDGYWEEAASTYNLVIARAESTDDQRAAAAFGKGRAALRAGLFDVGVEALTLLIDRYPSDYRTPQAYFLRGDAYLGLSNWAAALSDFQRYLQLRPNVIDSYAHERIGDAQLALGQFDAALSSYNLATQSTRSTAPAMALREKVAQVYLSSGDITNAISQYDGILAVAQNPPYRAQIDYTAAQALIEGGSIAAGVGRLARIVREYPGTEQALLAMQTLLENGQAVDAYARGRVYYLNGDYQNAIIAFNEYSTIAPLEDIPAELYLLLGRAYREVGNAPAALVAFETIVKQYPVDELLGTALLEQGRTRFLSGDTQGAIEFYQGIARDYAYLIDTASEALWRVGYLYGTNEQRSLSEQTFRELAERFPNTEQTVSGLKIAAAQALAAGDTAGADVLYSRVAGLTTGEDRAEAFLQVGRFALQRGDTQNANLAFDQVILAAPDTYYSARAADLKQGTAPFVQPVSYRFEFDDVAAVAEAETWLREKYAIPPETSSPLWVMSPELEADPRVIRGRELWMVGAFDAAEIEFLNILDEYETDGLASYRLALFMRGLGAYYPSVVGAANIIRTARVSTLEAPSYIARMRYPAYYRDVVLRISEERGIDPLLLLSLIRHESLFDTNATAAAGEKGLTQVIPDTAAYIAEQLEWQDYQHADLFRPHAGIAFGAFFLDEQLERFDGNVYAALAGYNAGPGRAISWLELAGDDPDAFMAAITIDSTRLYIQRIYSHYNVYRALYGG
jgi:soluble lytic murein transglycosylase